MTDAPLLGRDDAVPRRRWRWLLPLLIGVALVALVASLVVRAAQGNDSGAKHVLDSYLDAVQKGDTTTAYSLLCASASRPASADFAAHVRDERQNFGGVVGHRMGEATKLPGGDQTVTYTIQYNATYRFYAARMTHEADAWKVCGFKEIQRPATGDDTGGTATTR